jgi:hypothetical protein
MTSILQRCTTDILITVVENGEKIYIYMWKV